MSSDAVQSADYGTATQNFLNDVIKLKVTPKTQDRCVYAGCAGWPGSAASNEHSAQSGERAVDACVTEDGSHQITPGSAKRHWSRKTSGNLLLA